MDLMCSRRRFYEDAADYIVEADNKSFEEIIEEIKEDCK